MLRIGIGVRNKSEEFTHLQELVEELKKKKRMSWERSQILPRSRKMYKPIRSHFHIL